jgi:hypothetical protein
MLIIYREGSKGRETVAGGDSNKGDGGRRCYSRLLQG